MSLTRTHFFILTQISRQAPKHDRSEAMNEVWAADEVWAVDKTWPLNTTDVSLEDYLLMKRGPKHLPLTVVIPITLIYTVIFFSGVVGNIATCLVIITNPSLHNATNYYLFSLSMSDITLLLLGIFSG